MPRKNQGAPLRRQPAYISKKVKKLMFTQTHSADQLAALGKQVTMGATAEEGDLLMKWMGGVKPSQLAKTRGQNKTLNGILKAGTSSTSAKTSPSGSKKAAPLAKKALKKKTSGKIALKTTKKSTRPMKKAAPKSARGKKRLLFLQTHSPGELAALGKQRTMGATAEEGAALVKWMGDQAKVRKARKIASKRKMSTADEKIMKQKKK